MQYILRVAYLLSVLIISSCSSNEHHVLSLTNALNEGLIKSTKTIESQNRILYNTIEQRTTERQFSDNAKVWFSKAKSIRSLSNNLDVYIEALRNELVKDAGIVMAKNEDFHKLSNRESVKNVFNSKNKDKELFATVEKCKSDLLKIDSSIEEIFRNTIVFSDNVVNSLSINDFTKTNVIEAFAILSELQNKIKINENEMLTYCLNKTTPYIGCGFSRRPKLLINQSSSYVKAGDKINVNVGIGNFNNDIEPTVLISNKEVPIGDDGTSSSVIKASFTVGKHLIPVKVTYIDDNGNEATREAKIEYEVAPKLK